MKEVKLDPTIIQFKQFLNNYPELVKVVREEGRSWQEYYEKWALLGEDDFMWEKYKRVTDEREHKEHDFLSGLITLMEYVDFNTVDKYINQFSNTVSVIQELLSKSKGTSKSTLESPKQFNSFSWFRD